MAKPILSELRIHEIEPKSFIYEVKKALASEVCRDMIRRFEANKKQQYEGRIGQSQSKEQTIKRSTDLRISGRDDWKDIDRVMFQSLSQALNELSVQHPYFAVNKFKDEGYNMQRTKPGEFYHCRGEKPSFYFKRSKSNPRRVSESYFHLSGHMYTGEWLLRNPSSTSPPPGPALLNTAVRYRKNYFFLIWVKERHCRL